MSGCWDNLVGVWRLIESHVEGMTLTRARWRDDIWTMKYLSGFKWEMLGEQVGEWAKSWAVRTAEPLRPLHAFPERCCAPLVSSRSKRSLSRSHC